MTFVVTSTDKLPFPPDRSSYAFKYNSGIVSTELDGGMSKVRLDVVGNTSIVNCSWVLKNDEFEYFMIFYHVIAKQGAAEFKLDLILNKPELQETTCRFVPDSLEVSEPSGLSYFVSAQLEVKPIIDESFTMIGLTLASNPEVIARMCIQLEQLVNTDLSVI